MIDEEIKPEDLDLADLGELINTTEDNPPKDKRKKEYRDWVIKLNHLFDLYNKLANHKVYVKIK